MSTANTPPLIVPKTSVLVDSMIVRFTMSCFIWASMSVRSGKGFSDMFLLAPFFLDMLLTNSPFFDVAMRMLP